MTCIAALRTAEGTLHPLRFRSADRWRDRLPVGQGAALPRARAQGDIVILGSLSSHKTPAARTAIRVSGARLLFQLPPAFGATAPTSI
jgi:hypothetical protein